MSDFYVELAAVLRDLADRVASLSGRDLPELHVGMTILPLPHEASDEQKIAVIDALATALIDMTGKTVALRSGGYHYDATSHRGAVKVGIFQSVTDPAERAARLELERLRAEVDELRQQRATLDASTVSTEDGQR